MCITVRFKKIPTNIGLDKIFELTIDSIFFGRMQDARNISDIASSLKQSWKSIKERCNRLISNPHGTLRSAAVGVVGKMIQPILKGRSVTNPVHDHDDQPKERQW
jgi:hypothetical protein